MRFAIILFFAACFTTPASGQAIPVTTRSAEARGHYERGIELQGKHRMSEAIDAFRKAVEIDSTFSRALVMSARHGNPAPAAEKAAIISRAVGLAGGASEAKKRFAEAGYAAVTGAAEKAIEILEVLVSEYPDDIPARQWLGYEYYGAGRFEDAVRVWREGHRRYPDYGNFLNNVGYGLRALGKFEEAEAAFLENMRRYPDEPNPYDSLAALYVELGRYDEAIAIYERLFEFAPGRFRTGYALAHVRKANRQLEEAVAAGARAEATFSNAARAVFPGGRAVRGKDQIAAYWSGVGPRKLELETEEVRVNEDWAYETGSFRLSAAGTVEEGSYLTLWMESESGWIRHRSNWTTTDRTSAVAGTPTDDLPPYITRLTHFGERAEWSHDGRKILFLEKTFGDVYEIDVETRDIRPITTHFYHEGFLRAMYLSTGDILLFGPPQFDPEDPYKSRWRDSQLWVLDRSLTKPPVPLGTEVFEGAAVSRTRPRIAWMIGHADYYDVDDLLEPRNLPYGVAQFWMADVDYSDGEPKLANKKLVLDTRSLGFRADPEPQAFRRPDEEEIIFAAYRFNGIEEMSKNTEVMGVDVETGEVTNYTNSDLYEEPEGIFPDGLHTLVESDRHRGGGDRNIDIYDLPLDGSGEMKRLTFFNDMEGYKASNPVVSDDGRYIAFQMARSADMPGVGRGIFIYDLTRAPE